MDAVEAFFARKREEAGVELNAVQKQAVLRTDGPLLLLASPGSGKTTTLIMRIGYLIEVRGISPSRIAAITFSRAAAADMRDRFRRLFPAYPDDCVSFSTIHSMAFEITRSYLYSRRIHYRLIEGGEAAREGVGAPGTVGDTARDAGNAHSAGVERAKAMGMAEDRGQRPGTGGSSPALGTGGEGANLRESIPLLHKQSILRELYRRHVDARLTDDQMEELTTYISFVKNKLLPPERWSEVKCDVLQAERILREYEAFKRTGADRLLIDYDDMLAIAHEALERDKALLARYRRKFDYVLTDESQDTSYVQHAIVGRLVQPNGNLCVVADDDQSIYGWRAAEPGYLLDFKRHYPRAALMKMTQNYRSSRNIVDIANRFIKRNEDRYDKQMFTDNPPDKPIVIKRFSDYRFQAEYIVEKLADLSSEQLGDTAVLYRNNASSIALMNALDRAGVPFYMKDGDNRFFSHWVVEDVLNFMRMSYTDKRPELFGAIHLKCIGYVSKRQMSLARQASTGQESVFDLLAGHAELRDYQVRQLREAQRTFPALRTMTPREAIRTIRAKLGYERSLEKTCEHLGFRKEQLIGIVNTLEDIARGLETLEQFAERLKHLEAAMRASRRNRTGQTVTLSTLHSAKGLEFEQVYIVDLIEGILPAAEDVRKYDSGDKALMEEAVRLFYVGMTRAKTRLELLTYQQRDGAKTEESRFVAAVRDLQDGKRQAKAAAARGSEGENGRSDGRSGKRKKTAASGQAPSIAVVRGVQATARPLGQEELLLLARIRETGRAYHLTFGEGEVVSVDEDTIRIRFEAGIKKLQVRTCLSTGLLAPV